MPALPFVASEAEPSASTQRTHTLPASMLFVAMVLAIAWFADSQLIAVYGLGFWHYLLYALAYRYGAVPLATFKRDAVLMKSVALLALASAYLAVPIDVASLALVIAGFLLNALAAAVLGSDRTYYGHEVAGLPRLRVRRFPYSLIAHPMLVGNVLAFGGMLLNADFREQWWPLACIHVAMNLGLLAMERHVMPLRLSATGAVRPTRRGSGSLALALALCGVGALLGIAAGSLAGLGSAPPAGALGAAIALYGHILCGAYTAPSAPAGARLASSSETLP